MALLISSLALATAATTLNPVYVRLSDVNITTTTTTTTAIDADPRWFLISQPDGVTEAIGIAFANEREGFLAGGANGVGAMLFALSCGNSPSHIPSNLSNFRCAKFILGWCRDTKVDGRRQNVAKSTRY